MKLRTKLARLFFFALSLYWWGLCILGLVDQVIAFYYRMSISPYYHLPVVVWTILFLILGVIHTSWGCLKALNVRLKRPSGFLAVFWPVLGLIAVVIIASIIIDYRLSAIYKPGLVFGFIPRPVFINSSLLFVYWVTLMMFSEIFNRHLFRDA